MPSTFTANNGLEKVAIGEQSGTWGTTWDATLDNIDSSLDGVLSATLSGSTFTLAAAGNGRVRTVVFGGTPGGTCTVSITPNTAQKTYVAVNTTVSSVIVTQGSGGTVTIPTNQARILYANGAGAGAAVKDALTLTTDKIPEGTAKYFTSALARAAISATGQGIAYSSSTGVITSSLSLVQGWTTRVASFTAAFSGGNYIVNAGVTASLPSGGVDGSVVGFINGIAGGFLITPPAGQTIMADTSLTVDIERASFALLLIGTDWRVT
jgi:hypothetical protein